MIPVLDDSPAGKVVIPVLDDSLTNLPAQVFSESLASREHLKSSPTYINPCLMLLIPTQGIQCSQCLSRGTITRFGGW